MTTAIIGGTGLDQLDTLTIERRQTCGTPYGQPSAELSFGRLGGTPVVFLPRHGDQHSLPPHRINYRANIWALRAAGVSRIVAVAAVGGITAKMEPGAIAFPDQIIDYTYGREHTFADGAADSALLHVDFSYPYAAALRDALISAAGHLKLNARNKGIYGATQGPRLETAAEIARMEHDGCDLVGMTGMPEAGLAREADLPYACVSVVVNWAAGKSEGVITMDEISRHLTVAMEQVKRLLPAVVTSV